VTVVGVVEEIKPLVPGFQEKRTQVEAVAGNTVREFLETAVPVLLFSLLTLWLLSLLAQAMFTQA